MDKFGSLFGSSFAPGDGEAQTAELKNGYQDYDFNNMRMDIPNYGREGMPDSFNLPPQGPVMPPNFGGGQIDDMRYKGDVLPPGFDDAIQNPGMPPLQQGGGFLSPIANNFAKQLPGQLAGFFGGLINQQNPGARPMPQPTPMPFRQPNFRPDTRAPGGGGMDYNGNPIGGGMGAQFNFAGPPRGMMQQPMPQQQPRMAAPMRAPGPVRPAMSNTRTRRR